MNSARVDTPTSRVRFGHTRVDITPPVGIYHRCWGAAPDRRAGGVHKPLFADAMVFGSASSPVPAFLRVQLDLGYLTTEQNEDLVAVICEASNVPCDSVLITCSHTHSVGWFASDRYDLPGGEKIRPYLEEMKSKVAEACKDALANVGETFITYAAGRCDMAANRDRWNDEFGGFVTGYNPDAPADDTLLAARITDLSGNLVATVVNYACHATSLAWENTLISPDFVGAMRETVEHGTGAPCVYAQGASGDLGPRYGFVGDTAVADQNGRQLALAALSTLEAMGPPATDFEYQGPVISGATLGPWAYVPFTDERLGQVSHFAGGRYAVDLPLKPKPGREALQEEHGEWLAKQKEADEGGDAIAARDYGARAERAWRWMARLDGLPGGTTYPFHFSVYRMGDAVWVTTGGEPYNQIQVDLRRRFPNYAIIFSPLSGEHSVAYLLPEDRYGKGLYQEEPSILAPGCLETLIEAITEQMQRLTE